MFYLWQWNIQQKFAPMQHTKPARGLWQRNQSTIENKYRLPKKLSPEKNAMSMFKEMLILPLV
jgi:hypothetical protein